MLPLLDRVSQSALASGIALMLQPWWAPGFRAGFFLTVAATVAHIVTSRLVAGREDAA